MWAAWPRLPKGHHLGAIENACYTVCSDLNLTQPQLNPALAADIQQGRWVGLTASSFMEGLSLLRITTAIADPDLTAQQLAANRAFSVLHTVTGSDGTATQMVLNERGLKFPMMVQATRSITNAYSGLLAALFGRNTTLIRNFYENFIQHWPTMEEVICTNYRLQEKQVCIRIMVFLFRMFNNAFSSLLRGPRPTAANPIPTPQRNVPFGDVLQHLVLGKIHSLTDIPDTLMQPLALPAAPSSAPAPAPRLTPGPAPAQVPAAALAPAGNPQCQRVDHPNQNIDLKQASTASQHRSVFGNNGAFADPAAPGGKRIIMRSSGNTDQRICLPMAVHGVCYSNCTGYHGVLTQDEVRAVANAGGLNMQGL
ncbi:hypothetical protein SEMRO_2856_G338740.1 [Seminavis robusta]|uniref:Uncharacterized protein n=1 Tax=Seminavis robusta TaxID=568900 RepID=A0A9N8I0S4_9STRA|nr:hypothetical protein SEMRO_2856_G338740.1 [Seminavis robusta]|eukprot:Sro2856_g338740.1 n/a (367) ;mRNA; f:4945-6045